MGGQSETVVQDVEMEAADSVVDDPETQKKDADLLSVQEIRDHVRQIEKAVVSKEPRFILRVLRSLPNTRRKINSVVLRSLINHLYPVGSEKDVMLSFVDVAASGAAEVPEVTRGRIPTKSPLPEVDAYLNLLLLVLLIDSKQLQKAQVGLN